MRFFNASGPAVPADHCCIPPLERVDPDDICQLVHNKRHPAGELQEHPPGRIMHRRKLPIGIRTSREIREEGSTRRPGRRVTRKDDLALLRGGLDVKRRFTHLAVRTCTPPGP